MYKTICARCNRVSQLDNVTFWSEYEKGNIVMPIVLKGIDGYEFCEICK